MVGFQIASQIGQVIFSTPMAPCMTPWAIADLLHHLRHRAGSLIYGFFVIKKDDQEVGGDPFYTDKQLKAQAAAEANA